MTDLIIRIATAILVTLWCVLILLAVALLWLYLLSADPLHAAPAPLPKRAAKAAGATLPAECVMWWNAHAWRTSFHRGGGYEAHGESSHYFGTWWVERQDAGAVLCIREARIEDPDRWSEYRIWLAPCLRKGSIGREIDGDEFRLE